MPTFSYTVSDFIAFTKIKSADVNSRFQNLLDFFNTTKLDYTNIALNGTAAGFPVNNVSTGVVEDSGGPYLRFVNQGSDPSTAPSGQIRVYSKSKKLYFINDVGTITQVGAGSSGPGINYIANMDAETDTSGWSTYNNMVGTASASKVIQDLTYTATSQGNWGNSVSLQYAQAVGVSVATSAILSGYAITVTLGTDSGGVANGTATAVRTAVLAVAASLVSIVVSGTGSNVQTAQAQTFLTGGTATGSAQPTDASTGHAITSLVRSTSSPLRGTASFVMSKDSVLRQGEGVNYAFTIDAADKNRLLNISFDYSMSAGFLTGDTSDLQVFIWDVTNNSLIIPTTSTIRTASGNFNAMFASTGSTSYILALHVAGSGTNSWTAKFDNVVVGPFEAIAGYPASPSQDDSSLFSISGIGTAAALFVSTRRMGDRLLGQGYFTTGTAAGTILSINLPARYPIDLSKLSAATGIHRLGIANRLGNASNSFLSSNAADLFFDGSTTNKLFFNVASSSVAPYTLTKANGTDIFGNNENGIFFFDLPIAGWGINANVANSQTLRIADVLANGSRVTGSAPTALGQYRSYIRSSGNTFTETNGSPATAPTASNGVKIWAGGTYAGADTNNNPTKYDIFVGKNKQVKSIWFQSTGRTGFLDARPILASATSSIGYNESYDPTTGIYTIDPFYLGSETSRASGMSDTATATATLAYFDLIVSENALSIASETLARSEVWVYSSNGYGSTNNKILRWSTVATNTGSGILYADSATAGSSFTIQESGIYSITLQYQGSGVAEIGISRNSSQLTTGIPSINAADRIAYGIGPAGNYAGHASATLMLNVGDVIRPHTDGAAVGANPYADAMRITKVSA